MDAVEAVKTFSNAGCVVVCLCSAPSGLYTVLMAPVKGLGSYLYLLLIELLNGVLPAENGQLRHLVSSVLKPLPA